MSTPGSPGYKAKQRRLAQAKRDRWLAAGCCVRCGIPVTLFRMCLRCRLKQAKLQHARRVRCVGCAGWAVAKAQSGLCRACVRRKAGAIRCATAQRHPVFKYLLPKAATR